MNHSGQDERDLRQLEKLTKRIRTSIDTQNDAALARRQLLIKLHGRGVTYLELAERAGLSRAAIDKELRRARAEANGAR